MFELSTTVSSLRHLRESDLSSYDAVYLGNVHCRRYEGNLLERPHELREAIRHVRREGRRARLTTYAVVRDDVVSTIRRALEVAAAESADAVEIHALGLLPVVREEFPFLHVHVGRFAHVYTDAAVRALVPFGVARVVPGHELTLDELDALHADGGVPLEIPVHGKLPLGVSDWCLLVEHAAALGGACPDLCQQEVFLRKDDDWALKSVGTAILGGRDDCLLEHLPRLVAAGHRYFHVEAGSESPAYRHEVGAVYREALARVQAGEAATDPRWWETLRRHSRLGLCSGFAAGRSGMAYVPAESVPRSPR